MHGEEQLLMNLFSDDSGRDFVYRHNPEPTFQIFSDQMLSVKRKIYASCIFLVTVALRMACYGLKIQECIISDGQRESFDTFVYANLRTSRCRVCGERHCGMCVPECM